MRVKFLFFLILESSSALAARSVSIDWEKILGATEYELKIRRAASGEASVITSTAVPTWTGTLAPGNYFYQVRAMSTGVSGPWSRERALTVQRDPYHVSAGIGMGTNYFFPVAQFETTIASRLILGIMPLYMEGYEVYTRFWVAGLFLTVSYQLGQKSFFGLYPQAGLGAYLIQEPMYQAKSVPVSIFATLNWRQEIVLGIDLRVGAGAQFAFGSGPAPQERVVSLSGLLPLFFADVGFLL